MEVLQRFIGRGVAETVDEELRIEDVLARSRRHRSRSGGVILIPCIDRVPSTSSRWKTTRSSARSIVSVAVAAPSARFAALSFDSGNRYVRETRRSRRGELPGRAEPDMIQCIDDRTQMSIHHGLSVVSSGLGG